MATQKEVHDLKEALKQDKAQRKAGAKAFRALADKIKTARTANDWAAVDTLAADFETSAADLEA